MGLVDKVITLGIFLIGTELGYESLDKYIDNKFRNDGGRNYSIKIDRKAKIYGALSAIILSYGLKRILDGDEEEAKEAEQLPIKEEEQ